MHLPPVGGRHWNFYLSLLAGIVAAAVTLVFVPSLFPAIAVSVFSLVYLVLTAKDMPRLTADYLRAHAGDEDAPPLVVFLLAIGIVVYAVAALFLAVNDSNPNRLRLGLGVASVILSWIMINTMWGMHYAWEYYGKPEMPTPKKSERGGLEFAGEEEPDGMDFIYYSMTIAMTDQTSDTNVTSRMMRRITTGHGLFSYFFNTVIVAAAVNIVVQLGQS